MGSSPLTRGKRLAAGRGRRASGLIPAHAGKTAPGIVFRWSGWAHPRSRGENRYTATYQVTAKGSSPLTRGKLVLPGNGETELGLIPAHAGKTGSAAPSCAALRAHPRSRGENVRDCGFAGRGEGSSPLTRGKHHTPRPDSRAVGLIPAHAGKTWRTTGRCWRPTAHPRSRGENVLSHAGLREVSGSSPLTRGKRRFCQWLHLFLWLIPAHAGKTQEEGASNAAPRAHPRSRGENSMSRVNSSPYSGSSPLTRGKRATHAPVGFTDGLIPAHAGKTSRSRRRRALATAHPRSRGENPPGCKKSSH